MGKAQLNIYKFITAKSIVLLSTTGSSSMEILSKVGKPMGKYQLDRSNDLSPVPLSIFTPIFHASNFLSLIFYFSCTVPPKPNKHHLNFKLIQFPEI